MKYQEFLDYIYQRHSGNVKLGLERMHNILKAMNDPHLKLQGIHIAGTNGKGSTAAMCEAMSLEHHISTGLNTSPHLVDYRERIRIDGKNIKFSRLLDTYKTWEHVLEKYEASFFEITTAMAFMLFHQHRLKNSIFEVGLGGRLDGTNPFAATVCAITSISYDHPKSLGDSVEKIAFEKAGIIKSRVPVVIGKMASSPRRVVKDVANSRNAPTIIYGEDFHVDNVKLDETGTSFDFYFNDIHINKLRTNLIGKHQALNAGCALVAFIKYMQLTGKQLQLPLLRTALQKVNWLGRMQILAQSPTVIIDGAHNEEGIESLVTNLKELFPHKRLIFVLAILRDKKLEGIIENICSVSDKIYISKNRSKRAAEIEEQADIVKKHMNNYTVCENVIQATKKALKEAEKNDIIMISGSLYTISEVLSKKAKIFT